MSDHRRATGLWHRYAESAEKFDYFVLAVALGLAGYLGERFTPTALGLNPATLELVAVALNLVSAYAGFRRLEYGVMLHRDQSSRIEDLETADALEAAALQAGSGVITGGSSGPMTTTMAHQHVASLRSRGAAKAMLVEKNSERHATWYRWRNRTLVGGLLALLAAKLWASLLLTD